MTKGWAVGRLDIWRVAHPVTDLDRSVAFYCGQLGFDLDGRDDDATMRQAFVSLGKGGFAIELFVPLGDETGKPHSAPDHLAFDAADLRAYRDSVVASGAPVPEIEMLPGGMQHFVLTDPDGLRLDFFQGRALYDTFLAGDR